MTPRDDKHSQTDRSDAANASDRSLHLRGLPAQLRAKRRFSPAKIAFQLLGLAVSIALLIWLISIALSDDNRQAWTNLADASPIQVAALFGATAASITFNGLIFWALARGRASVGPVELVAVNAICTLLASLPFKLGVLVRGLIHHRRDQLPFKFLIAWFATVAVLGMAVFVPLAGLSLWRGETDALWWAGAAAVFAVAHGAAFAVASFAQRQTQAAAYLRKASLGAHRFLLKPSSLAWHALMRGLDIASLAGRFMAASWLLGFGLGVESAVLLGCTFFLLSVLAPTGNLGVREAGTTALAAAVGLDLDSIGMLVLIVSGAELLTAFVASLPAAVYVRLDRVLLRPPQALDPDATESPTDDQHTSDSTAHAAPTDRRPVNQRPDAAAPR